jgi:hypothetical protein
VIVSIALENVARVTNDKFQGVLPAVSPPTDQPTRSRTSGMRILQAKSQKVGLAKVLVLRDGVVCLPGTAIRQTLRWMVMAVNEGTGRARSNPYSSLRQSGIHKCQEVSSFSVRRNMFIPFTAHDHTY